MVVDVSGVQAGGYSARNCRYAIGASREAGDLAGGTQPTIVRSRINSYGLHVIQVH